MSDKVEMDDNLYEYFKDKIEKCKTLYHLQLIEDTIYEHTIIRVHPNDTGFNVKWNILADIAKLKLLMSIQNEKL